MGFYTPKGQVWYPATSDTAELNVLMSTLATSIEEGIVPRTEKLELNKGMMGGIITDVVMTASATAYNVPYGIHAFPHYNNGMTVTPANGTTVVNTPGLYSMNVNFFGYQTGGYVSANLYINGVSVSENLAPSISSGTTYFFSGVLSATTILAAGDVIKVTMTSYNRTSGTPTIEGIPDRQLNTLSATLIKAT